MNSIKSFEDRLRPIIRESLASLPKPTARAPLATFTLGEDELLAAITTLLSGQMTMASEVEAFEREFAAYVGSRNAVMVNSGSSANLLLASAVCNPLYRGQRPQAGKTEAIVPAVSWSTSVWPLIQNGFTPVFTDVDLETFMPDPASIANAVSDTTGLIFCVHLLGGGSDIAAIARTAKAAGAVLIEDSCEALGTTIHGRQTGTLTLGGTYSFFFSHHITTGEGGMVVTDDDELGDVLRIMRSHGWARSSQRRAQFEADSPHIDPRFLFVTSGFNIRPTEMAAAMGRIQLKRLADFNTDRRTFAGAVLNQVAHLDSAHFPKVPDWVGHTWYGLPFVLKKDFRRTREDVVRDLSAAGIETRPIVAGNMARQPAFRLFPSRHVNLPNADLLMERGIYVGVNPGMGMATAEYVGEVLRKVLA